MLTNDALSILRQMFERYQTGGSRTATINFQGIPLEQKSDAIDAIELLEDYGYIEIEAQALGFYQFKLTPNGIDFANNDFQEPIVQPIIQGDNSIYVSGSYNQVQNCYNNVSLDIAQSDLSDDIKELIQSLLYELQNPHCSKTSKKEKIKNFLSNICGDALSSNASAGLTALISSLFSQLPL